MREDKAKPGSAHVIDRSRSNRIEAILVAVGALGCDLSLAHFGQGGLVGSDVLAYMNVALNGIKSTDTTYFRYFYLFLARIFIRIAPTPLVGAQWFWAFLITASGLLIYLCGRLFAPHSRPVYGLLAAVTFLSLGDIGGSNGSPGVDLAAMFMAALLLLIYLLSARQNHKISWLIALFGFFLYLALRTKETCLTLGILMIGFGFTEQDQFDWTTFGRNLLFLLSGFLAGLVFFALCMAILVGDPLFGLRLSEFKDYLASYAVPEAVGGQQQSSLANWFTGYFFVSLLLPFVLYIMSGLKIAQWNSARRWVWLLPLAVILFVTVTIGARWGLESRFILPALPPICVLWPQALDLDFSGDPRKRNMAFLISVVGLVTIVGIRLLMRVLLSKFGWDTLTFLNVIFNPIVLICILAIFFLFPKPGLKTSLVISLLVIAMFLSPILGNFNTIFINGDSQTTAAVIFYPFSTFSKQIAFTPQMRMYISIHTWEAVGNPYNTKNVDEVISVFNDYFNASSTRSNFVYDNFNIEDAPAILREGFTYLLFSRGDWRLIAADPSAIALAKQNYQVFFDPHMVIVLLKAH
jgi:hypothetical protein